MESPGKTDSLAGANMTKVERTSDLDLVVTRTFKGPRHLVFEAWTTPGLLMRWWTPKSFGLTFMECEADVRPGGVYRFVFGHPSSEHPMEFTGKYADVIRSARLVWSNDEEGGAGAVTTVTFEDRGDETIVVLHDRYPSKEALDGAIESGSTGGFAEAFGQLEDVLAG